jgi:hypothetical protein
MHMRGVGSIQLRVAPHRVNSISMAMHNDSYACMCKFVQAEASKNSGHEIIVVVMRTLAYAHQHIDIPR